MQSRPNACGCDMWSTRVGEDLHQCALKWTPPEKKKHITRHMEKDCGRRKEVGAKDLNCVMNPAGLPNTVPAVHSYRVCNGIHPSYSSILHSSYDAERDVTSHRNFATSRFATSRYAS